MLASKTTLGAGVHAHGPKNGAEGIGGGPTDCMVETQEFEQDENGSAEAATEVTEAKMEKSAEKVKKTKATKSAPKYEPLKPSVGGIVAADELPDPGQLYAEEEARKKLEREQAAEKQAEKEKAKAEKSQKKAEKALSVPSSKFFEQFSFLFQF